MRRSPTRRRSLAKTAKRYLVARTAGRSALWTSNEKKYGWAARQLRRVPYAGKPLHWASQHKALILAGATVGAFGAAGLAPAAIVWGGARLARVATRGPRNLIRNNAQKAMGKAKEIAVDHGGTTKTALDAVTSKSKEVWKSDLVSLQRERGKQVLAKAHHAAATKPGLKYMTHSAHSVASGVASGVAHAAQSVQQTAHQVSTITSRTREINREKTQQVQTERARLLANRVQTRPNSRRQVTKVHTRMLKTQMPHAARPSYHDPAPTSSIHDRPIKIELVNEPQTVNPVPAPDTEPVSQQQPDSSASGRNSRRGQTVNSGHGDGTGRGSRRGLQSAQRCSRRANRKVTRWDT